MTPDWDHFLPMLNAAINRFPILSGLQKKTFTSEPDSFSPDGRPILGEAEEIKNYYVAAATNGNPMQIAGGLGEYISHWVIHGERHAPLLPFDILRFNNVHNCRNFLRDRVPEVVGNQCEIKVSNVSQYSTARNIRCSPLHTILQENGAVFGESMCFERAAYFDKSNRDLSHEGLRILSINTYQKPEFFEQLKEEYTAHTDRIAISDISWYSKFTVSSPQNQVVSYLQNLCSNNIDIEVGSLMPTGMQNKNGGYSLDCLVGRLSTNRFFILCPPTVQTRAPDWMRRFLPSDNSIEIDDTTSKYSMIEVSGPKSTEVLSELAHRDMKMSTLKFQIVSLSHAPKVNVTSFTASTTTGYSVAFPSEYALHVYKQLMHYGKICGIQNTGYLIHRSLRMEKHIGCWGDEIHGFCTPVEIGRMHRVDLKKDFIGKDAILNQLKNGVTKRLTYFTLNMDEEYSIHRDIWPWSGEPIYRNGVFVGRASSITYGFTHNVIMIFAFINNPNKKTDTMEMVTPEYILDKSALYQIMLAGKRYKLFPTLTLRAIKNPVPSSDQK